MKNVLFVQGLIEDSLACDTIIIEVHAITSPYNLIASGNVLLNISGLASFPFPPALMGTPVFIVVKGRNSIETWSKLPITLGTPLLYDFAY